MTLTASDISVLVHIVTYNHASVLPLALQAMAKSEGVRFETIVTDNGSSDGSSSACESLKVKTRRLPTNIGFCAAHNSIVNEFLSSDFSHLCILNPDVALEPGCLCELAKHCDEIATPKLLRGDETLRPISPTTLDAAGMVLTNSLRHFDRGSQLLDSDKYSTEEFVFGGTGACLVLSKSAVRKLLLPNTPYDFVIDSIHPGVASHSEQRKKIFDEAFFAYREDAELAWRAQRLGVRCKYVPSAVAVHKRAVLPTNRSGLSPFVNYLGVRNRFLLQLLHFSPAYRSALLSGLILRNFVVIAGVILREQNSLKAFSDLWRLRKRSLFLRRWIRNQSTVSDRDVSRWLNQESENVKL